MQPELAAPPRRTAPLITLLGGLGLWLAAACGQEAPTAPTAPAQTPSLVEQALPAFVAARGKVWPPPGPRMMQVHQALSRRDDATAKRLLEQVLARNPGNHRARHLHSEILFNRSRFDVANAGFEQVLRGGPSFAGSEQAFYFYGMCQVILGNASVARESLEAMLELKPGYDEALFSLGWLEIQEGNPTAAIPHFEAAIEAFRVIEQKGLNVNEALARCYIGLGNARVQLGELERAKELLQQGLYLNPRHAKGHYALGRVLLRLGDHLGANRELEEFERLKPNQDPNQPAGR